MRLPTPKVTTLGFIHQENEVEDGLILRTHVRVSENINACHVKQRTTLLALLILEKSQTCVGWTTAETRQHTIKKICDMEEN